MRLDIGAGNPLQGESQGEGYVLNDVEAHQGIDLVCNITDLGKHIEKEQCSEIRASHVLEHFGRKEGEQVIQLLHSLLENNGLLLIYVPNFKWHAQLLLSGQDEQAEYYAYGGQLDEFDYHKTGFTVNRLKQLLEKNGFTVAKMFESTSIECLALKTPTK